MRWEKKLKKRHEQPREFITRAEFKKCLFRFLKEFGYYRSYIKNMKDANLIFTTYQRFTDGGLIEIKTQISFDTFLSRSLYPTARHMFPYSGASLWEKIYNLWVMWAKEEYKITWRTRFKG